MTATDDEGVLDPWVEEYFEANPERTAVFDTLDPEILELARGDFSLPSDVEIEQIDDAEVNGIPIRIYRHEEPPTGLVVYFHGGGMVIGSIGIMDNVARQLCNASGAVVISVGYRLAPENPYPAGLEDCETVTRWAIANASTFGVPESKVAIAGESAGGNLSAALALRLRDTGGPTVAGQVLIYPRTAGSSALRVEHGIRRARHQPQGDGRLRRRVHRRQGPRRRAVRGTLAGRAPARPPARDRDPRRLRHAARRGTGLRRPPPRGRRRRRGGLLRGPAPRLRQLRLPRREARPRSRRCLAARQARRLLA